MVEVNMKYNKYSTQQYVYGSIIYNILLFLLCTILVFVNFPYWGSIHTLKPSNQCSKSLSTRTAINMKVNESLGVGCIEQNDKSLI